MAKEVKAHLDAKRFDLIDPDKATVECWPNPEDKSLPECGRFAAQWRAMFTYADKITGDGGEGFPDELAKEFEAELKKVEALVNDDQAFWEDIRGKVMPLYCKTKFKRGKDGKLEVVKEEDNGPWKDRWKKMVIFYDPVGMDVTTTEIDPKTRRKGRIISSRTIPEGFVFKVL